MRVLLIAKKDGLLHVVSYLPVAHDHSAPPIFPVQLVLRTGNCHASVSLGGYNAKQ